MTVKRIGSIPEDAFDLSLATIVDWLDETYPTTDGQDIINLAVAIDNHYHGFDDYGNQR